MSKNPESREHILHETAFSDWVHSYLSDRYRRQQLSSAFCNDVWNCGFYERYFPIKGTRLCWAPHDRKIEQMFFNEAGKKLAIGYHKGELTYDFCDWVANDLYGVLIVGYCRKRASLVPALFDEVYLCFDAGELHRSPDKSDNPVRENTDPAIACIVARLSRNN